jgi:transcriptional regulator with XRE-family HTH domain
MPNLSSNRQNPVLIALGDAIRHIRQEQGMSQEKLALHAEVNRSYVGQVERGDNTVSVLTLKKLADALGITMTELMAEAEL